MRTMPVLNSHGGEDDDQLPGSPWTPDEPSPDGTTPPGDGTHRKQ